MNSRVETLGRLLRLFPVKSLIDTFDAKEKKQDEVINEILKANNGISIMNFVRSSYGVTKQSVYVYTIKNNYQHKHLITDADFGYKILSQNLNAGVFTLYGYQEVTCDLKIYNGAVIDTEIKFLQPFKVVFSDGYLLISITKLESNLKTFLPSDTVILSTSKPDVENLLVNNLLYYFDDKHKIRPQKADLNRGVKELWEGDIIDGKEVSCREKSSRTRVIMDGETLYKDKYPKRYANMMRKPLEFCIFRYILDDEDYPRHFTCDPGVGKLSFGLYSSNIDQVNNVLNGIIRNN